MKSMEAALAALRRHLKTKDLPLHDAIHECGISPEREDYPVELVRGGLNMQQEPLQLVRFLRLLNSEKVKSIVEIGICDGGDIIVVIEYLASLGRDVMVWAIDPAPRPSFYRYVNACDPGSFWGVKVDIKVFPFNSSQWPFGLEKIPHFDLGIVDGNPTIASRTEDMKNISKVCTIMAVHDLAQLWECRAAWDANAMELGTNHLLIMDQQPSVETTRHPICGYGVLWTKNKL